MVCRATLEEMKSSLSWEINKARQSESGSRLDDGVDDVDVDDDDGENGEVINIFQST